MAWQPTKAEERTIHTWRAMTPEQRDYDRLIAGRVPQAVLRAGMHAVGFVGGMAAWTPETAHGRELAKRYAKLDDDALDEVGCTCMRSAPCSWCMTHCPDCHARLEDGEDFDSHRCERAS